jgi:hypothetical protein
MHLPQPHWPQVATLIAFAELGDRLWFLPGNRTQGENVDDIKHNPTSVNRFAR